MGFLTLLREADWSNPSNVATGAFIIGASAVLILVSLLFEVSIGMSAFSALMWSTLPWSMPPLIGRERRAFHERRLLGYLHQAIQLFFISSLFFVAELLDDTTHFFSLITYAHIPSAIFLYAGFVTFATAMGFTYMVVDWTSSPEANRIENIYAAGMEIWLLIGLSVFEVLNGYILYGVTQAEKGLSIVMILTTLPLTVNVETVLVSVSLVTYFYALKVFREQSFRRRVVISLVFFSPYLFLIIVFALGFLLH